MKKQRRIDKIVQSLGFNPRKTCRRTCDLTLGNRQKNPSEMQRSSGTGEGIDIASMRRYLSFMGDRNDSLAWK
jgi:hypothetical protein